MARDVAFVLEVVLEALQAYALGEPTMQGVAQGDGHAAKKGRDDTKPAAPTPPEVTDEHRRRAALILLRAGVRK